MGLFSDRFGKDGFNFFSKASWKDHAAKTGFKGLGTVVGVGAVVDATFRSKTQGADGRPEDRSFIGRGAEFVIGAALAAGSALHR